MSFFVLFLCGLCVGFLGAFLGLGGGIIIIPLLTIVFDIPIHEAVATSLAIVVANSIAISNKYISAGTANLRAGILLGLFSVSGAIAGSFISMNISSGMLYIILGCAQLATAFLMVTSKRFFSPKKDKMVCPDSILTTEYFDKASESVVRYTPCPLVPVMSVSGLSGLLSGLVGVGGGVFVVPAMNLLAGMPIKAATSTSGFLMGFTAAAGGILFFLSGYTNSYIVVAMVPGIFIATSITARLFARVNSDKIHKLFVVFLAVVAVQMLYRGTKGG